MRGPCPTKLSARAENLGHILETRALLCVIASENVWGEAVVETALSRDGAGSVVVMTAAPGNLAALLDAFHTALYLGVGPQWLDDARPSRTNSRNAPRRWWPYAMPTCCGSMPCSTSTDCGAFSRSGNAGWL
ncbi:hypothetical protein GCM10010306_098990 [Streptomyces umbrinus]|nr:hypothetical protein GCM10010306_098990 [Streptomyces umbrinus]